MDQDPQAYKEGQGNYLQRVDTRSGAQQYNHHKSRHRKRTHREASELRRHEVTGQETGKFIGEGTCLTGPAEGAV
jgi:hypothetical protein